MSCFIYMMISESPLPPGRGANHVICKIGISGHPQNRLSAIRTSSPFRVSLARQWCLPCRSHAEMIEKEFHSVLARSRMAGEWFVDDPTGMACTIEDVIVDHAIEKLGKTFQEAANYLTSCGVEKRHAADTVLATYGVETDGLS